MSSRHLLLQPRWIVAHVMILTVIVTFPLLGRWQLDRWDEEKRLAARIDARIDGDPVPLTSVLGTGTSDAELDDLEFQPVTATGRYLADEEVAHRNRSLDDRAGFDWLTPLQLADGTAVLVRRGFVPPERVAGSDPTVVPPVDGEVTVTGWLELSGEQPSGIGARDPAEGTLETVFHADVSRIDRQVSADLLPMVLHLRSQAPAPEGRLPVPQPEPRVDTTQNLSYAVQWFSFTGIAVIGYAIVLSRKRREADQQREEAAERREAGGRVSGASR